MKKKKTPPAEPEPTSKSRLGAGAKAALALPLAISAIPALISKTTQPATTAATKAASVPSGALPFKSKCQLPFKKIKKDGLDIDAVCSNVGRATDNEEALEFQAKNNFCASGEPTAITYQDLVDLQKGADSVNGLRDRLEINRNELLGNLISTKPKLGEGTLVQMVAFLKDARNSNTSKGEKVNCNLPGREENDIHIELMNDSAEQEACKSVTAEMSPHFRPSEWQSIVKLSHQRPSLVVRVTGSLFFDNSHQPCHGDKKPNPKRISVWEIHPVYQFEICKNADLKSCDIAKNELWTALDELESGEDDEESN
jgi:hypothetical protein